MNKEHPRKTPEELENEVMRLYTQGRSKREIQNATGIGWGTVYDIIERNGPQFHDKNASRAAVQARLERIRQRRLTLAEDLTVDAERMRERVWGEYIVPMMGMDGVEEVRLAEPPLKDQADGMRAIESMIRTVDTIIASETVDETAEAKDVINTIFAGLKELVESDPPPLDPRDHDHDYDTNDNLQ